MCVFLMDQVYHEQTIMYSNSKTNHNALCVAGKKSVYVIPCDLLRMRTRFPFQISHGRHISGHFGTGNYIVNFIPTF